MKFKSLADHFMRSYSDTYGCSDPSALHVCDPCLSTTEFGRVRSCGWIRQSYLATLLAAPTVKATWTAGIASNDIIIVPESAGAYDPGDPKVLAGYGERQESYGARQQTLTITDPNYAANFPFYANIQGQVDLVPFYRTSSLVHIGDVVASIIAKNTVADDLESEVNWSVISKWTSNDLPIPIPIATLGGVFTCTSF